MNGVSEDRESQSTGSLQLRCSKNGEKAVLLQAFLTKKTLHTRNGRGCSRKNHKNSLSKSWGEGKSEDCLKPSSSGVPSRCIFSQLRSVTQQEGSWNAHSTHLKSLALGTAYIEHYRFWANSREVLHYCLFLRQSRKGKKIPSPKSAHWVLKVGRARSRLQELFHWCQVLVERFQSQQWFGFCDDGEKGGTESQEADW